MTVIPFIIGELGTVLKGFVKGAGIVGNQRTGLDHPDYGIVIIGPNTERSSGN